MTPPAIRDLGVGDSILQGASFSSGGKAEAAAIGVSALVAIHGWNRAAAAQPVTCDIRAVHRPGVVQSVAVAPGETWYCQFSSEVIVIPTGGTTEVVFSYIQRGSF